MSDRHDIALRQASGAEPNPPGLLLELRDLIKEVFPESVGAGMDYIKGKGAAEVAKAAEIRAAALEKLGRLELERQKLVEERDAALRDDINVQTRERREHERRMYELRTQRLKDVVDALKVIKEMDVKLAARLTKKVGEMLLESLAEPQQQGE